MSGDEWHLHASEFLGNRARLLWIAGVVADLELELLAEHTAGGVDVGNRELGAILHLLSEGCLTACHRACHANGDVLPERGAC